MEGRVLSLVLLLVQSSVQYYIGEEHNLRPEGLKIGYMFRDPRSEFMDFDPDQNGSEGLLIEIPQINNGLELISESPGIVAAQLTQNPVVLEQLDVIEVKNKDGDQVVVESFVKKLEEEPKLDAALTGYKSKMKRDLSFVDSGLHDFFPRRLRVGKINM